MSDNLYMSDGLESLLPESFQESLKSEENRRVEAENVRVMSLYSKDGVDRFLIEFLHAGGKSNG